MWTGLKENSEYTAQITPCHGYVIAEIICRGGDNGFYDNRLKLWLTVMDKFFGSSWRKAPKEEDWQKANDWVNKQLQMIGKYGTVVVTKPKHILDFNRLQNE